MKNRKLFHLSPLLLSFLLIASCSESPKDVFMHQCVNNSNAFNKQECECAFTILTKKIPEDKLAQFMASKINTSQSLTEEQRQYLSYSAKALQYCSQHRRG
ncbi:hypothetical protein [Providencia sp.]|uniref:hypothetical protein n=2 Tax=Enterobacterales TaxID=91347 RepID=UPI0030102AB3